MHLLEEKVIPTIKRQFDSEYGIRAILLMGSTASKTEFSDWDDFDLQVYTDKRPPPFSHYELLRDSNKRFLVSAYFLQFDPANDLKRTVLEQRDVKILFGSKESLRHIFVDRPRRIASIRPEYIPLTFATYYENYFNILVDIFFILNRYERRGKRDATKPRVARDGLRAISSNFHQFYGVNHTIPKGTKWRKMIQDVTSLFVEKRFAEICRNKNFAEAAIELMGTSYSVPRKP